MDATGIPSLGAAGMDCPSKERPTRVVRQSSHVPCNMWSMQRLQGRCSSLAFRASWQLAHWEKEA